ncbi:dynein axonemal assembly factor 4-like [Venturia canescens]|uniref:dynein axonemal assembly factor 4-like n=1 Tax=Venturia canescens TaxID=32260 RepID=UPI001C9BC14E|nr:dynein axonemal assembly factor 4-like [Venturia canescens]
MPAIIVNEYTWRQNHEFVIITTRLTGHPKKIDLFAVNNYFKASYPPFIFELFLRGAIVEESSECTIGDETVIYTLKKQEIGAEWPSLEMEDLDKSKKRAERSRAFELAQVSAEEKAKAKSKKCQALQRRAVRAQIDLDTEWLNKIESMRDSHRKEAMKDFEDWRNQAEKPILQSVVGSVQENRKAYRPPLKWFGNEKSQETSSDSKIAESERAEMNENNEEESEATKGAETKPTELPLNNENGDSVRKQSKVEEEPPKLLSTRNNGNSSTAVALSTSSDSSDSDSDTQTWNNSKVSFGADEKVRREFVRRKKREMKNRGKEIVRRVLSNEKNKFLGKNREGIFEQNGVAIPRPRKSCTIDVKFTERQFPTPARESIHLEEQEWLEKQAEARRKTGFVSEDLRPEEQDPQWLKEKGDEFFKAGNYLGALSAYSHGIKLSEKMSSLYVNRSAAHYAAENYQRCAEDCSKALELMVPKCEGNRDSRARCHARLGAALCKLSAPQHGIPELEAALKLAPENETIKRDLEVAKRYFEIKD